MHVVATVLGLSALFKFSPTLYMAMKLLGAAYLLVAFFSTRMTRWIKENPKAQIIQNRISGTILATMGLFIAGEEVVNPSEQNVNP